MAIFRGVGGSGSSSDNSFLQEVTAQATIATNKASEASASATSAEASATSAANSLATIQNTEVTSASFNTGDGVLTLTKLGGATVTADLDGRFLTSYTETNDLSSAVTWVNVPNAYITEGSVTQHQSAINANVSITESQISDLQSYLTSETSHADVLVDGDFTSNGFMKRTGVGTYAIDSNTYLTSEANNLTTAVTWANVPDANITQSSVTQHQAALSITESQISDLQTYLTAETNDLSTTVTWANVPDANITESSVTQHQAALSITESQISDLGTYLTASDITGKANLSGATFTGGVSIGTLPSNPENLSVTGATNLYGGASVSGNITVTGTVDGRDVATDGARLDTIPYHRVRDDRLSSFNQQLALTTTNQNLGQYQTLYHPSTPVETMRFVDVEWTTLWSYVSSTNNDIRLSLYLTVPSTVSAVSIGTVTAFTSSTTYSVRQSNEQWYYISGDYTHLFTEFCRISQSSSGSIKQQVLAVQYRPDLDRTYFCATNTTVPIATGDTVYFHPYAWQGSGSSLLVYKDIAERYRSGFERHNVAFKLPYTDDTLTYKLNIKELASTDSAVVKDAQIRITSTGI